MDTQKPHSRKPDGQTRTGDGMAKKGGSQANNYLLPIIMMFALFFMIAFITGLQNPIGAIVRSQFSLGNLGSQLPNFANFLAYACFGIPAGLLLQRIGYKRTALTAIAVGMFGIIIMLVAGFVGGTAMSTFGIYLFGAFVGGISMCMLNTVVNPMLNTLGNGGNRGNQLIQLGGSCNSIAATIAPVLGGYVMGGAIANAQIADAATIFYIALGIFALAFAVLYTMAIPEPRLNKVTKDKNDRHSPLSFRHFVLGIVAIFVYVGVEVGIPNIGLQYLTRGLSFDTTVAGSIVGTYWFLMLVGRLVGASVGAKVSSRSMLSFVAGVALIFVCAAIFMPVDANVVMPVFKSDISFGMAEVPVGVMFLILCGLCTSVMWGGIFNLAVEGLGKYTEAASGIFMVMVCGGGILPLIQGGIADVTTYLTSYWLIAACLAYILFYALYGSKNVNKDIITK